MTSVSVTPGPIDCKYLKHPCGGNILMSTGLMCPVSLSLVECIARDAKYA